MFSGTVFPFGSIVSNSADAYTLKHKKSNVNFKLNSFFFFFFFFIFDPPHSSFQHFITGVSKKESNTVNCKSSKYGMHRGVLVVLFCILFRFFFLNSSLLLSTVCSNKTTQNRTEKKAVQCKLGLADKRYLSAARSPTSDLIIHTCKLSTTAPQYWWAMKEKNDIGARISKQQQLDS